ncbi:MAG: hypothetical protein NBKEAIPA_00761 [Nitrospirae bacterium]|nr:MAG: hypothetical protein UZ03_NOB001002265 [Nitrospira sp. OLB3]MBV6468887.1 hypothetical protein [Nitrospirota bacterium]MCK6492880.1 hypothetical protein [Nitrospira sp.]MEB2339132.1 hypothetical protein [Nitrospirales bacterium]QOJ34938.1 MAG: hypothetical protein HRU82_08250 [Nitrospira sp.]
MRYESFKTIVWVLVGTVVLLLATTTGGAVAHELQHAAHHGAGMHASSICSWMCATAGVHVVTPVHLTQVFEVVGHVPVSSDGIFLTPRPLPSLPRAPPVSA